MIDGVCGLKVENLYRHPPALRAAEEALESKLRSGSLTLVLLPAGQLTVVGSFDTPTLPASLAIGADVLGATLPVVDAISAQTHVRTLLMTPDVAFSGAAAADSLVSFAPIALARPHLYAAQLDDDADALTAAEAVSRAIQALDTRLRVRDFDAGATDRYKAAVAALDAEARDWGRFLPDGAPTTLMRELARCAPRREESLMRNKLLMLPALRPEDMVEGAAAAAAAEAGEAGHAAEAGQTGEAGHAAEVRDAAEAAAAAAAAAARALRQLALRQAAPKQGQGHG